MAIAILTTDLVTIATAEVADTGAWSGGKDPVVFDTVTFIQGTASAQFICNAVSVYDITYTPAASINIGTSSVLRLWAMITDAFQTSSKVNGGIRIFASDGTNTGYWNYDGSDTYDGGWKQFMVDTGTTPTTGTAPNWAAITSVGLSLTYIVAGKNTPTVWVDAIRYGNSITAYSGTSGDEIGIEEIYAVDMAVDNAYGIVVKNPETNVYSLRGTLNIGDVTGANTTYCKIEGKVIIAEANDWSSTDTFNINIQGNATGATDVKLYGCFVNGADKQINMSVSSTNINALDIDGNSFSNISGLSLQSGNLVKNNVFDGCYQINPGSSTFESNTLANTRDTVGALLFPIDDSNLKSLQFINCSNGIEYDATSDSTSPALTDLIFDDILGNYDVNNTSGLAVTIALSGTSNANSYNTAGSVVTFQSSSTLVLTVKDESGAAVGDSYAYIDDDNLDPFIMNTTTDSVTGIASTAWTGGEVLSATWRVRKYGYKPFKVIADVPASGIKDIPVTLVEDPQQS